MASKKLIILSLFAVVSSLFAETAADYVHRGAQKYIFGQEEAAEAEVATGLAKFPNDPELQELAGLVHKKKPPPQNQQQQQQQQQNQQQQQQQNQQQQQKDQQQQQQQQGQGEQQQKDQQQSQDQQSQGKSENQKDQQEKNNQLQAKNQPQKNQQQQPGETPSPSPGAEKQQGPQPSPSPGERQGEESPSPGEGGENETPSPSPGEGENENATPSATPGESPQKKFAGEVKGAGDDKSQKPPDKNAQVAEAEPEKEGQMSERQAEALLESMKDEEARVQLDERRATRHGSCAGRNGAFRNSSYRGTWRRRAGGNHGGWSRNSANGNVPTHRDEQPQFNLQCDIRLYCDAVESGKIHYPASNHSRWKQFAADTGINIKRRGFARSFVWRAAWSRHTRSQCK